MFAENNSLRLDPEAKLGELGVDTFRFRCACTTFLGLFCLCCVKWPFLVGVDQVDLVFMDNVVRVIVSAVSYNSACCLSGSF